MTKSKKIKCTRILYNLTGVVGVYWMAVILTFYTTAVDSYTFRKAWFEEEEPDKMFVLFNNVRDNRYDIINDKNITELNITSPNGDSLLHIAVKGRSTETLIALLNKNMSVNIKDKKGRTPLWVSASIGNAASMKLLVKNGADIHEKGGVCKKRTLLHETAIAGNIENLSWLLDQKLEMEARECDGWTAFHWAAYYGHSGTIKLMVRRGGNVNVKSDFHTTPIHCAAARGHLATVLELIFSGARLDEKDIDGNTAIHKAAIFGQLEVIRILVDYGANVNIRSNDKSTAMGLANHWGYNEVTTYLMSVGGIE